MANMVANAHSVTKDAPVEEPISWNGRGVTPSHPTFLNQELNDPDGDLLTLLRNLQ